MATFKLKRKSYSSLTGNIVGYTGSMPIYDNSPGVGKISNTTTANTAEYQKMQLDLLKQREKQENERLIQQMKMEQQRQEQQEKLQLEKDKVSSDMNKNSRVGSTPDPKLIGLTPKPMSAIPMNK